MSSVAKISRKQRRLQNKLQAQVLSSTYNNTSLDSSDCNSSDIQDDDAPDSWTKVSTSTSSSFSAAASELPFNVLLNKVSKLKRLLLLSKFYSKLCEQVFPKIREFNPDEIVCYGIGSFSTLSAAQIQLALLLIIRDELLQNCPSTSPSNTNTTTISTSTTNSKTCFRVLAYDPVFSDSDSKLLSHFGILIIPTNEAAKRYALSNTLFYMPHCEAFLYDNLLFANSTHPIPTTSLSLDDPKPSTSDSAELKPNNLFRLMIIGNDLSNLPRASKKLTFINKFSSSVISIQFPDEDTHLDSSINRFHPFNDTALMTFNSL
ncbi:SRR1-like protein [Smittium culicis]|uniref:SRR1-like protein n=1 Tax=Smittium culicis TaxID=133412 RepID=A0A1R1YCM6_9FUNG|nr:SRR1-like protein [Smittium culicis]